METETPNGAAKKKRKQRPSSAAISPWSAEETGHLIDAYGDKCQSLRRAQLKSAQWEEVSVTVAARSGHDDPNAAKSALQCRHKMEKLRQRFRSLLSRPSAAAAAAPWPFFAAMSRLLGEEPQKEEEKKNPPEEGCLAARMAAEITDFTARMAAVERAKMAASRETETRWMEMERKRIDMIARSETNIVDSIARVFGGSVT